MYLGIYPALLLVLLWEFSYWELPLSKSLQGGAAWASCEPQGFDGAVKWSSSPAENSTLCHL